MVKELTGSYVVKYHANGDHNDPIEIDFTPPFRYQTWLFFMSCYVVVFM